MTQHITDMISKTIEEANIQLQEKLLKLGEELNRLRDIEREKERIEKKLLHYQAAVTTEREKKQIYKEDLIQLYNLTDRSKSFPVATLIKDGELDNYTMWFYICSEFNGLKTFKQSFAKPKTDDYEVY